VVSTPEDVDNPDDHFMLDAALAATVASSWLIRIVLIHQTQRRCCPASVSCLPRQRGDTTLV
jgi:hypothetical protein